MATAESLREWLKQRAQFNSDHGLKDGEDEIIEVMLSNRRVADDLLGDIVRRTGDGDASLPLQALQAALDALVLINTRAVERVAGAREEVELFNRDIYHCFYEARELIARRDDLISREGIANASRADWPDEGTMVDQLARFYFNRVIFSRPESPSQVFDRAANGNRTKITAAVRTVLERFANLRCNRAGNGALFPGQQALAACIEISSSIVSDGEAIKQARRRWLKEYRNR